MAPKFGTSGLRGKVDELTDGLCADYARAFLSRTPNRGEVLVGRDLRPSSERIAGAVASGARSFGLEVLDCGCLPTPALAMAAIARGAPSVMITGSHIPADRNGLKFYTATGEITKTDETAIAAALAPETAPEADGAGIGLPFPDAVAAYGARYRAAYGPQALRGLRIGLYEHSSVARDLIAALLGDLGAAVVRIGRAGGFVPVDTEAVSADLRAALPLWTAEHRLDAIVSTDGDADRPLVADAAGRVVPGDVLGILTAAALGAGAVVTPVSSSSAVELSGHFARVLRTRIGSPYVIAGIEALGHEARPVGFEANGGFLLGFYARGPAGPLPALATRDALLPILAPLAEAAARGQTLAELVAGLPARFTASDRLQEIPTQASAALVARLTGDAQERRGFFAGHGAETAIDTTDGLRVSFASGVVLHLRPSGNAPELRCYAEAGDAETAERLVPETLARARRALGGGAP